MEKYAGWLGATITGVLSEEVTAWLGSVWYLMLARFYCASPAKPGKR